MKKLPLALCFLIVVIYSSCKKNKDDDKKTNSSTYIAPYGILNAVKHDIFVIYGQAGGPTDTLIGDGEDPEAFFTDKAGDFSTLIDPDSVILNGVPMERNYSDDSNYFLGSGYYDHNVTKGIKWEVKGKNTVPHITYADASSFPDFTGTFPEEINKSKPLTMTFNSSTVLNADSIAILVDYDTVFYKSFPANAGTVTLTPADLATIPEGWGMPITIMPFTHTIQFYGGKPYAFRKEKRIARGVFVY